MPYGIQQPAISKQIRELERELGVCLFERQPFRPTAAGNELYTIARRLFDELPALQARLRRRNAPQLRIAASEFILSEYVPEVMQRMKQREPKVHLVLRAGTQQQMRAWLADHEIDLAIASLDRHPTGLNWLPVVKMAPVLLVPKALRITRAAQVLAQDGVTHPFICPASTEGVCQVFQRGLQARGLVWEPTVDASSTALVTWYVAQGQGIGVSLDLPRLVQHPKIRVIPLPGFAPVEIGALWSAPASPLLQSLLAVIGDRAKELWPEQARPSDLVS